MTHFATAGSFLGLSGTTWFILLTFASIAGVVWSLSRKLQLVASGSGRVTLGQWGKRIRGLLVFAFGQKRMFKEPAAGLMHALIFWGFLVFSVRSGSLVVEGLTHGWELPFLHTYVGHAYLLTKDVFALIVFAAVCVAAWRRLVTRPARLELSLDA